MREIVIGTAVYVLLECMSAAAQARHKRPAPCPVQTSPTGWPTYVDRLHGFCFSYPPTYEPVPKPWLPKYTHSSDNAVIQAQHKTAREGRLLRLQNSRDMTASITVLLEELRFNLESLIAQAPTGIETPPYPTKVGANTFYYYGAGGGGAEYPDGYFFDLNGKALLISFDGPYVNDKTPSQETKDIEKQLLETFRTF